MSFKTEAFVLRARTWREADKVFDLFTPQEGIINAVLRSAAKPGSKISGHMLPFSKVRVMIGRGKLDHLAGAHVVKDYQNIRGNLRNLSLAAAIAEIFLNEDERANRAQEFRLLEDVFDFIDNGQVNPDMKLLLVRTFLWKYLSIAGWQPELNSCLLCKKTIEAGKYVAGRGIICIDHADHQAVPISQGLVRLLKFIIAADLSELNKVSIDKRLNQEWLKVSQLFYQAVYERPSQALKLFVYG